MTLAARFTHSLRSLVAVLASSGFAEPAAPFSPARLRKPRREERSERPADRREAGDCSNGVLASAASEGSIDERSESIGERSEP
ncbi:hypothetical protein BRD19_11555 [Halobacteriales archaeon SW_7_65_23]|nr:MAG: hypothetical protein BRD19_11555 [Halobacteriales archaeon SW_7_65_23]